MPSSGPRSGKHGAVAYGVVPTVLNAIRNWTFNLTSTPEDYVHSGTLGGHDRSRGVWDANGTFEQFGGVPVFFPGDLFGFIGFYGPDTGVYGTNGNAITMSSILDSLTITWDWSPGGRLSMSNNFSSNGCPDMDNIYDIVDTPNDCPNSMCDLSIWAQKVCDIASPGSLGSGSGSTGAVLARVPNVVSATLNFTAANNTVNNSSTFCCTERRPGNVDWNLVIIDQDNYNQFDEGDVYFFRLFISSTLYWDLAWGIFTGVDNINANRETGDIISKSNNFAMKGFLCCGAATTPTTGYIHSPGAVVRWPIAPI